MTEPLDREARILAFLDGALDDAEQAAFEAELAADPALAAEVERLAGNDALLRAAFLLDEQVDEALLARMGLADPVPVAPPVAANDNPPWYRRFALPLGGAIAAGLALMLTIGMPGGNGTVGFSEALDATPSGQFAMLDGDRRLTPVLSFEAEDGRFCREFTLGQGAGGNTGIACRDGDGWQVEALEGGAADLPDGTRIGLAAGAENAALDAAYARLGASDPLPAADEAALIAGNWKKTSAPAE